MQEISITKDTQMKAPVNVQRNKQHQSVPQLLEVVLWRFQAQGLKR